MISSVSLGKRVDIPDPLAEPGNIIKSVSVAVRKDPTEPLGEPGNIVRSISVGVDEPDKDFRTHIVYVD